MMYAIMRATIMWGPIRQKKATLYKHGSCKGRRLTTYPDPNNPTTKPIKPPISPI